LMIRGAGRYSTLITPTAGSLFHAEFHMTDSERPRSPFAGVADLSVRIPLRMLSPDEIEQMLASHRRYLDTEYHEGHRANFSSVDLTGRDFAGLSLRGIKMDHALLRGANFHRSRSARRKFDRRGRAGGAFRQSRSISGAPQWRQPGFGQLRERLSCQSRDGVRVDVNIMLRGACLREADMSGAVLDGAVLTRADLRQANLRGAGLRDARLDEANLRGARLGGALLVRASLRGSDLRGAYMRLAKLDGADLSDANLEGAEGLTQAQLDKANLNSGSCRKV